MDEIDAAPPLAQVVGELGRWAAEAPFVGAPIGSWCSIDRLFWSGMFSAWRARTRSRSDAT